MVPHTILNSMKTNQNKTKQNLTVGGLDKKKIFPDNSGCQESKVKCSQDWFFLKSLSLAYRWLSSP